MRVAMGILAIGAFGAGLVQIPKVDFVIDDFLAPSFVGSRLYEVHERSGLLVFGLVLGTVLGAARASRSPTACGCSGRARRRSCASALRRRCISCSCNKWYFDELIDALVVRPAAAIGALRAGTRSSACSSTRR